MEKIPQTYHIITIGCQMNKSDSERIAAYLENLGYEHEKNKYKSDLVILTTCGVRQSAESRVYGFIPRIKKENPRVKIILTGCLSERQDVRRRLKSRVDIWLPIAELSQLAHKLGINDKPIFTLDEYLSYAPKYSSPFSAFVPIGNGCDNFCAYCVVPYARGREKYRPSGEIISEVRNLAAQGYKEITLIAQNVNSYRDFGRLSFDFSDLLKEINALPSDFWLRFASSHPKDMSEKLIKTIAASDKVCEHIHLPAQAGNNEILERMNRRYTIEHYLGLLAAVRKIIAAAKNIPVSITTDIIVGFPGETEKQFDDTARLFETAEYDMAYIARYSPRPGTTAEKYPDDVSPEEKKRREERLTELLRKSARKNNEWYLGRIISVLVENTGSGGVILGKSRTGKVVKIINPSAAVGRGDFVKVKITTADDFGLTGEYEKPG